MVPKSPLFFEWPKWVLVCGVLVLVAGCAGRPKNVLLPVADTAPTSSRVEMLVTTTRSRSYQSR